MKSKTNKIEFSKLLYALEINQFEPILGDKIYEFLDSINNKNHQIQFLEYLINYKSIRKGDFIHPDYLEGSYENLNPDAPIGYGPKSYWSRFFNPDAVRELFLSNIPSVYLELQGNKTAKFKLRVSSSVTQFQLTSLFEELVDHEIILPLEDYDTDNKTLTEWILSDNILDSKICIKFNVNLELSAYILEEYLFKYFINLNRKTVESSAKFMKKRTSRGQLQHITEKAIRTALSQFKSKIDSGGYLEKKKLIDKIFSETMS